MKKSTRFEDWYFPAWLWAIQLLVTVLVMYIFTHAVAHGTHASGPRYQDWFGAFAAWDGEWYMKIAENGYETILMTAFFPLYPLLVRFVHDIFGISFIMAGFIISNMAFLAALILLYKLAKERIGEKKAQWTLILLVCFPTAFFFNVAYTESLTLLLTVLFFYLLDKQRFYPAILVAMIMSANKQIGAFLSIVGMVYLLRHRAEYTLRALLTRIGSLALIPVGLFAYMGVLYYKFDNPFAFLKAQEYWERTLMIPIVDTVRFVYWLWYQYDYYLYFWNYKIMMLVNGFSNLLIAGLVILMFIDRKKNISIEMKIFALISLLIGTTSGTSGNLQSFGRFMVVIFPAFIMWGSLYKREIAVWGTAFLMFAIKVILLGMFGNGYEIT